MRRDGDGPIAAFKCRETRGFATWILVNAKADDGHRGEACEMGRSGMVHFLAMRMRN